MKFPVILHEDENGFIQARCPSFTNCMSEGKTEKEALENIKKTIRNYMEQYQLEEDPSFVQNIKLRQVEI